MTSAAYQINNTQYVRRAPRVRVVRGGRFRFSKAKEAMHQAASVLIVAVLLALITAIVASQAKLTELSGEIDATRSDLATAQTTYEYLSGKMDEISNSANIGVVAQTRLGLVKTDPSQVTYVRLEDESVIEKVGTETDEILDELYTAVLSLIGSFEP